MVSRAMERVGSWALALALGLAPASSGATALFVPLGQLLDGAATVANDVSGDGTTVIGRATTAGGSGEAFVWTASGGMVGLGDLPTGNSSSQAWAVSGDGSVVAGTGTYSTTGGSTGGLPQAFRWTAAGGMVGLGFIDGGSFSYAYDVSADGSVVVGETATSSFVRAYRWTAEGGMLDLGVLPDGVVSRSYAVSDDGSVVVGAGRTGAGTWRPFRWTAGAGMVDIGDLAGGVATGEAFGVSADGTYVVGFSASAAGNEAYLWSEAGGMIGLGDLPGSNFSSTALGVSADGTRVVGTSWVSTADGVDAAFLWDPVNGMRFLKDVLEDDYGLDLTGWFLKEATAITPDGRTIAGWGRNPSGQTEAWLFTVPEPGTAVLVLAGLAALARRKRRRRA